MELDRLRVLALIYEMIRDDPDRAQELYEKASEILGIYSKRDDLPSAVQLDQEHLEAMREVGDTMAELRKKQAL